MVIKKVSPIVPSISPIEYIISIEYSDPPFNPVRVYTVSLPSMSGMTSESLEQ